MKKKSKSSQGSESKSVIRRKKIQMGRHKNEDHEEVANQIADDLTEFVSNYSDNVNINNPDVQIKIEDLADAMAESMSDYEDDDEDDFLSYQGDMDQYGNGDDDDA